MIRISADEKVTGKPMQHKVNLLLFDWHVCALNVSWGVIKHTSVQEILRVQSILALWIIVESSGPVSNINQRKASPLHSTVANTCSSLQKIIRSAAVPCILTDESEGLTAADSWEQMDEFSCTALDTDWLYCFKSVDSSQPAYLTVAISQL